MCEIKITLKGEIIDTTFIPTELGASNEFVRNIRKKGLEEENAGKDLRDILPTVDCLSNQVPVLRNTMFDGRSGVAVLKRKKTKPVNNIKLLSILGMPYLPVCDFGIVIRQNIYTGTYGEVIFNITEKFRKSRLLFIGASSEDFSSKERILLFENSFYYIPESAGDGTQAEAILDNIFLEIIKKEIEYRNFIDLFRILSSIAEKQGLIKGEFISKLSDLEFKGVEFSSIHSTLGVMV